jgi:hypothetical protein
MMYSQQEYDMMRRQTLQIEAEKRTLLRTLLVIVAGLLAISVLVLGFFFRHYSASSELIGSAEARAATSEAQYQTCSKELSEKKAILDAQAGEAAKQDQLVKDIMPRVLRNQSSDAEIARFSHAIYAQTGHMVALPSIPPDRLLSRRFRYRTGGQLLTYVLVAGLVEGQWVLYSNLVGRGKE